MTPEDNSIFDEISEEVRYDKFFQFVKAHQNIISAIIILICLAIVGGSAWHNKCQQRLELTTTNLFQELYLTGKKSDAAVANLLENAPAEIKPLIALIKSGRILANNLDNPSVTERDAAFADLLALSQKNGVDILWKDLAILIYASYKPEPLGKILERLEPLMAENRPFRYSAMERAAVIHMSAGEFDKAIELLSKITDSTEAPKTMKIRISRLINYIKNKAANVPAVAEEAKK